MAELLILDAVLFGILVFSGILGNIMVIYTVVLCTVENHAHHMPPSDLILLNLSLANLLTSLFRTVPIFISDLGLEVSLETNWCRLFMLLWVWWRSVGSWATLALSIFHYTTLTRKHVAMGPMAQQRDRRHVILALAFVWGGNLLFSLPAAIYTRHVRDNITSEVMVISCSTRPLLGCMWEFPSKQQGTAFASTSLALNEVLPLLLMVSTNLATLRALAKHIRMVTAGLENSAAHVQTERKAGQVIMMLVALFVVCWVMQVAAVTYYNYDGGAHTEGLLTVSQFSASVFVGFSPMVVALGHGKLRKRIVVMMQELAVRAGCRTTRRDTDKKPRMLESTTVSYKHETQTK
ncbi:olfactory receptor class A-like protein 4 [Silurus meridionalis]|uniref:G-protein coupled receptors family 1 profile domain-containing protein n=1 Tax=Silurus meridionalis TaxID=175797 RepID=A0A8T0ANY0_SILME|nr:olfactory receptor class A-like protein 4 [Silurus meridionalis]KAF7693526.1 hypothetical protein HF521_008842 [Silurus meridionalis]KAI5093764.1 tachykinin-like peptides receptor 86C [Silurus meridionalis]